MKLVIVESPAKTKTISKILGEGYQVEASIGHIRDLSYKGKYGLGIDLQNNFAPDYVVSQEKKEVVKKLENLKKKAEEVILATDPDREGEAIAWHVAQILKLDVSKTKRLEFHEITKRGIDNAIQNPRTINMDLVTSQETRRIMDRIIGFRLSSLLRSKIHSRSAGRVQSVTLKFIVDREREIKAFVPEDYWLISGKFNKSTITAQLKFHNTPSGKVRFVEKEILETDEDEDVTKVKISSQKEADDIINALPDMFKVEAIDTKTRKTTSKPAFTTSSLQQAAFSHFKYSTKKTAHLSQSLYEGKEINGESKGLITYIRTDSVRLSPDFIVEASTYITSIYGANYLNPDFQNKRNNKNDKNAQDAHEAIRPTDINLTPEKAKQFLSKDEYNLYKLIYNRTVASLMADKIDEITTLSLNGNDYIFESKYKKTLFKGYALVNGDAEEEGDSDIPNVNLNDLVDKSEIISTKHTTKAPSRYTEGRIVKLMEEKGIGRPSTYSSTISTLEDRTYIEILKGVLNPTDQGEITVDRLVEFFPNLMDASYTAQMETNLDSVHFNDGSQVKLLQEFCDKFFAMLDQANEKMEKVEDKETGETCPNCGKPLVEKFGRFGKFIACSAYPECKFIKKEKAELVEDKTCPNCGSALVKRHSKRGDFIGCSNYPKCSYIEGQEKEEPELVGRKCPNCGNELVYKKARYKGTKFIACSNYPRCRHSEKIEKSEEDDK